nr:hypothetical protein [Leminorella grimontii]
MAVDATLGAGIGLQASHLNRLVTIHTDPITGSGLRAVLVTGDSQLPNKDFARTTPVDNVTHGAPLASGSIGR